MRNISRDDVELLQVVAQLSFIQRAFELANLLLPSFGKLSILLGESSQFVPLCVELFAGRLAQPRVLQASNRASAALAACPNSFAPSFSSMILSITKPRGRKTIYENPSGEDTTIPKKTSKAITTAAILYHLLRAAALAIELIRHFPVYRCGKTGITAFVIPAVAGVFFLDFPFFAAALSMVTKIQARLSISR